MGLATNSFTISENHKLVNTKFGFSSWIVKDHGYPSIYILNSDLIKLQQLIRNTTLLYKIPL